MSDVAGDRYFEQERAHSCLRRADLAADDVFARAARGVRDVLRRYPTTIHNVTDRASALVARDPSDVQAWWALVGMGLWRCDNDFGSAGFRGLHSLGLLDAAGPVRAAFDVYSNSGFDPAQLLAGLVTDLGIAQDARTALADLARAEPAARGWVARVVERLATRP